MVEGFWPCAGVVFRLLFLSIYLLVGSVWMYSSSSSGVPPAFAQVPTVLFALPISLALRQRKSITTGPKYHRSPPRKKRRGWEKRCSSLRFSIPARNVTIRHDSAARPGKEGKRHQTQTLEKANPPSSPSAGPFDTKSKAITGVAAMQQGRGRKGGGGRRNGIRMKGGLKAKGGGGGGLFAKSRL